MAVATRTALAILASAVIIGCHQPRDTRVLGVTVPHECEREDHASEQCAGVFVAILMRLLGVETYDDPAITAYVTTVGERVARAAGDHRRWRFVVLDTPRINAFAALGPTIYVNRGMLGLLRSEAELAAVLGHEIGHVLGGHTRIGWDEARRPVTRSDAANYLEHRYRRDDEIQADEQAVLLAARAGYDPNAAPTMLAALAATDPRSEPDADDVHPWWDERLARIQLLAATQPRGGERGEARFYARLAALVVGINPQRELMVVGNAVIYAPGALALELPAGVTAHPRGGAVAIRWRDGSEFEVDEWTAALGEMLASDGHHRSLTIGDHAIVADSPHGAELFRARRAIRRDELEQLRPARIDFTTPRRLWLP